MNQLYIELDRHRSNEQELLGRLRPLEGGEAPQFRGGDAPCCDACGELALQCMQIGPCAEVRIANDTLRSFYGVAAAIAHIHDESVRHAAADSCAEAFAEYMDGETFAQSGGAWWDDETWYAACNVKRKVAA